MPLKVLYFTENSGFGGTEKILLTIFAGLDRARWEPVLVHRPRSGFEELAKGARDLGVRVWVVPQMKGKRDAAWVLPVARELRAERPAVFHAHRTVPNDCSYGLLAAVFARVPAIVVTQQLFAETYSPGRRLQEKLLSAGVDRYIGVSHEVARKLRPGCLFPGRKVQVIHNATPLAPFGRPVNMALRAELRRGTERPLVLAVARLDNRHKGLDFLVSAAARVPEAQFVFAGDGPDRASLEEQALSLGVDDRMTFLGHREDIPDLLASCDLFVLPSLYEGLPVSVVEAMAAGKPVVASAIGGTDEAVEHGQTGLLVPPGDPEALANAIRTVLSDSALAKRMGAAGRARANQEFSAETMIQRTTQVYEQLLSRRNGVKHS